MNKDQALGLLLFLVSIAGVLVYLWLVFFSAWWELILKLTAFAAVGFVLFIMGWIGYTLATTPPPKPIEEIEKQAEMPPPPPPRVDASENK
ncbi:MAG: transcriptional regulator [Thermoproteota archaeon]